MEIQKFSNWLACYLKQEEEEVRKLLQDETSTHFLIAWSLLEANCFNGKMRSNSIDEFADSKSTDEFLLDRLDDFVVYFHNRYQNKRFYINLMHGANREKMDNLIKKFFSKFSSSEKIYFAMVVIYRYRNNIFHGNKGIDSWLQYKGCISKCTAMMQLLIPISADGLHNV